MSCAFALSHNYTTRLVQHSIVLFVFFVLTYLISLTYCLGSCHLAGNTLGALQGSASEAAWSLVIVKKGDILCYLNIYSEKRDSASQNPSISSHSSITRISSARRRVAQSGRPRPHENTRQVNSDVEIGWDSLLSLKDPYRIY